MTTLVHICAWLFQNPRFARLWLATRVLLRRLVNVLVDLETGQVRDLPVGVAPVLDRHLQLAEVCVTRLVWLRAREIAGLPHMPNNRRFAYIPPRRLRDVNACAIRALTLLDRFWRLERNARHLAARMSQPAELAHATTPPDVQQPQARMTRPARLCISMRLRAPQGAAGAIRQTGPPLPIAA